MQYTLSNENRLVYPDELFDVLAVLEQSILQKDYKGEGVSLEIIHSLIKK